MWLRDLEFLEAKAIVAAIKHVNELAQKIKGKKIEDWPPFTVEWDEDPNHFYHSLDGAEEDAISDRKIGFARLKLACLDAVLQPYNKRTVAEVWGVGDDRKAAKIIVKWSAGTKMSPVWIVPTVSGEVGLTGGNHRLAVARAKGVEELPVIFSESDRASLHAILSEIPATPGQEPEDE